MAASAFAAAPDRAPLADEWGYRPAEGAAAAVNPPSITWVHERDAASYDLEWSPSPNFTNAEAARGLPWSVYTHHRALKPGTYYWRYRIVSKTGTSAWSRMRSFRIPPNAVEFPKPTMEQLRARIPRSHPRLFVRAEELPRLKTLPALEKLRSRAAEIMKGEPTPEPTQMGTGRDPVMRQFWWSNRVQTIKACNEAEVLSFLYLVTREPQYAQAARRWVLHLASWNPDGPTNWRLNDEAAMPILHRLARAYDWAYDALNDEDRARVRAAMRRRGADVWKAGQTQEGAGHLNTPYNSHGNRSWHKLAEVAVAAFDEFPEAERWLDFAVNKFYAAYPVWADDDGGWHEGLSYWAGYMVKATWWMDLARKSLGIDGFKKPFFANIGDYALYTAPPGSPEIGFGDLSFRPPSSSWSFVRFFAASAGNPYWTWWADQWKIAPESGEPVLGFLWGVQKEVEPKPPTTLPPSKVFRGTGVAILNTTLVDSARNVQVRFKSSPFGRRSHGHDPHNSFTLNAYGEPLLVNNVYRDHYGSPFHAGWCWSTKSQNALLVDGEGQKPHSADPMGRIAAFDFQDGLEYVAGEAAAAYQGKLKRYLRHVLFVKPDLVVIADEVEAAKPATFQLMLHARQAFEVNQERQQLTAERARAGVLVDYVAPEPLRFRQWDGYDPEPNWKYLQAVKGSGPPNQWHVEAATAAPAAQAFLLTVLRPYRKGQRPAEAASAERKGGTVVLRAAGATIELRPGGVEFASVRKGGRQWKVKGVR